MDVNGQLHAPATLLPGKASRYNPDRMLRGPRANLQKVAKRKFLSLYNLILGSETLSISSQCLPVATIICNTL